MWYLEMGRKCNHFELYDSEAGEWTRWGRKIQEKHPYRTGNVADRTKIGERIQGDMDEVLEAFRRKHGIPRYDESATIRDEYPRSGHFQFELLAMKVFLDEYSIVDECPYEVYGEDTDRCIFHLSTEKKEALGIHPTEVQQAFRKRINHEDGQLDGGDPNYFAGATFRTLALDHEILDSGNNYPINLNVTEIDRLSFEESTINQGFQMDQARIGHANLTETEIQMDVSFEGTVFEYGIQFDDVTVDEGDVNFRDARLGGADDEREETTITFENSTFGGRTVDFRNVEFETEANFSNIGFTGLNATFTKATFGGGATFSNSTFNCKKIDFSYARVEGELEFEWATFDGQETTFLDLTVDGRARFSGTNFSQSVNFKDAEFDDRVEFEYATFEGREARFMETTFAGEAMFEEVDFGGGVSFRGATFGGEANFETTTYGGHEPRFTRAIFEGEATFSDSTFGSGVSFSGATFLATANFATVVFDGREAEFDGVTFTELAKFRESTFQVGATFEEATFENEAPTFARLEQKGGVLRFDGTEFRAGVTFTEARFEGRILDFSDAAFEAGNPTGSDTINFRNARFQTETANFDGAEFRHSDVNFKQAVFDDCRVTFRDVEFYGSRFGEQDPSREQDINLTGIEVRGDVLDMIRARSITEQFRLTPKGETFADVGFPERRIHDRISAANDSPDAITTAHLSPSDDGDGLRLDEIFADYEDELRDDQLRREGILRYLREHNWVDLSSPPTVRALETDETAEEKTLEALARGDVTNSGVKASALDRLVDRGLLTKQQQWSSSPIRLNDAHIQSGRILQPGVEGNEGEESAPGERSQVSYTTVYELRNATIGDVRLEARDDQRVFDCFKFRRTTFDGFEFDDYKEALNENRWQIHTTVTDDDITTTVVDWVRQGVLLTPLKHGSEMDISALESTYLKAKNGADEVGSNKAASEFFQKELQYRRASHRNKIGVSRDGLQGLYDYAANLLLGITSGYGERPRRVIVFSMVMIAIFGAIFQAVWQLEPTVRPNQYARFGGALLLSIESFTTLVLGGGNLNNALIRFVGYTEGFIGAFLIALFVFTLTRSVHR